MFEEVLALNQRFYDAHEQRDIDAMSDVWDHGDDTICVHPGWPILRGWPLVEESWKRIFAGPGRNQFILTNVSATGTSEVVWVTLDENLMQDAATGTIAATNIYVRRDGQWRMVLHHGSPVMG